MAPLFLPAQLHIGFLPIYSVFSDTQAVYIFCLFHRESGIDKHPAVFPQQSRTSHRLFQLGGQQPGLHHPERFVLVGVEKKSTCSDR